MRQRSHFRNRRCLARCRRRLGRAFALKPAEEASSITPQIGGRGSRDRHPLPDRPPTFQAFRSVLSRTPSVPTQRLINGSRSYPRCHGVQSRRAPLSYHKPPTAVYPKFSSPGLPRKDGFGGQAVGNAKGIWCCRRASHYPSLRSARGGRKLRTRDRNFTVLARWSHASLSALLLLHRRQPSCLHESHTISFSPPIIPQTIRRRLPPDFAKCGGSENRSLLTANISLDGAGTGPFPTHIAIYEVANGDA